ncbi:N-acetyltransferase 8-like [Synchiropus splendidus]|uniref:N-acetyltransferase 8-like n=1 Tax=Synchiropus splendidus TaxID=270530 RepID=UPI00237DBB53|nr:N-acetyltransferase 8-like [Synchiropus splendidus]
MATFEIRKFQDGDAEAVKEIFALGMGELVPSSFSHILKQPLTQMVLMCTFCALLTSSKSFLLPILALTLLLASVRQVLTYVINRATESAMRSDLSDITESYLTQKDSCFWVAESDGRVVGSVACVPSENTPECLELKRMSVHPSHRGMGIAKALCRTVAEFTQDRGYAAVHLHTSMVATNAQKLYEHYGFEKIKEAVAPGFLAKITNFTLIEYKLHLKRS